MTSDTTTEYRLRQILQGFVEDAQIEARVSVRHGGDALLGRIECKTLADAEILERFILQRRGELGTRGPDASVIVQFPGLTVSLPLPKVEPQGNAARGESFLSKTFPTNPEPFAW